MLIVIAISVFVSNTEISAQCPGGYTQAQVNWDNLDYYWNSGSGVAPYHTYISNAREQTQRFGLGTTAVTIYNSHIDLVRPGSGYSAESAGHTGEAAGYTGQDVQYNPSANGQYITLTFDDPVSDPNFTLYDIDRSAVFTITATNNLNVATTVNVATYAGTILTIGGTALARTITANSTTLGNTVNTGAATITVPGLVNSITITVTTLGSDGLFYLSDINACVSGSFPTNWHQGANNRPFWGPTVSQPDYFLVTPDNDSCYYVDPATGAAYTLFYDPARDYINSFAYDPYNRYLYYISENYSVDANNKSIKRYNVNTGTSSTLVADISAAPLNIPTFNQGIESAGCSFYNGDLYLGIEGGTQGSGSSLRTRESIIWRIELDGSQNPVRATQVFAVDAATNGSGSASTHDWGDFIIKNGMIYDFNTARTSCGTGCYNYTNSKYHHYNMMTGNVDALYTSPSSSQYSGQSGMTWSGGLYYFRPGTGSTSVIGLYNEDGTNGPAQTITVMDGGGWPGGSGDASDPFRPDCDFGDAPASYDPYADPATQSPAVHERSENIRLGSTWDREYWKRGTGSTEDTDDGIGTVAILAPGGGGYVVQTSVYNNSGANATLIAWLDYNGNGSFDASEAITPITVTSSASAQNVWLYWPSTTNTFIAGQHTYMRVRITSASYGMTTAHATGYFPNGEVEDYQVLVDNFPLTAKILQFTAKTVNKSVQLNWQATEENGAYGYVVEKSRDNASWFAVDTVFVKGTTGTNSYENKDDHPFTGNSYYRLRIIESAGMQRFSEIRKVGITAAMADIMIAPNPVKDRFTMSYDALSSGTMKLKLMSLQGNTVFTGQYSLNAGANQLQVLLPESVSSGTYVARFEMGGALIQKKIIITR